MTRGNEPAYPVEYKECQPHTGIELVRGLSEGMTIRQRFVIAAMQGLSSSSIRYSSSTKFDIEKEVIRLADACLAEEERTRGK
ncbi:MAG: hypothetical protein GY797_33540 [Deltaproteobacteria bacterium]|nr:hypothetical protein [Deltaproteobacteria bacterium]